MRLKCVVTLFFWNLVVVVESFETLLVIFFRDEFSVVCNVGLLCRASSVQNYVECLDECKASNNTFKERSEISS